MPRNKKNDESRSGSSPHVIETTSLGSLAEQLRMLHNKIDVNQRETAQARAYAKEAKDHAAAARHEVEEAKENRPDVYTFKSKGNEKQWGIVQGVISNTLRAMTACEEGHPLDANHYHKKVLEAMTLRAKCIKIADSHPAGWALVEEYLMRDAVTDEKDDKKLREAEISCEAKYQKRKQEKAQSTNRGAKRGRYMTRGGYHAANSDQYSHDDSYQSDYYYRVPTYSYYEAPRARARGPSTRGGHTRGAQQQTVKGSSQGKAEGPCYWCRGPHMRSVCPELAARAAEVQASIEANYHNYNYDYNYNDY
jgi:hypothetical protein